MYFIVFSQSVLGRIYLLASANNHYSSKRQFTIIRHYSQLLASVPTIRTIRYSRLFAIRYSGFPDTQCGSQSQQR